MKVSNVFLGAEELPQGKDLVERESRDDYYQENCDDVVCPADSFVLEDSGSNPLAVEFEIVLY